MAVLQEPRGKGDGDERPQHKGGLKITCVSNNSLCTLACSDGQGDVAQPETSASMQSLNSASSEAGYTHASPEALVGSAPRGYCGGVRRRRRRFGFKHSFAEVRGTSLTVRRTGKPALVYDLARASSVKSTRTDPLAFWVHFTAKSKPLWLRAASRKNKEGWVAAIQEVMVLDKPSDFDPLLKIGAGYFGNVYLARHKLDSSLVAVKEIKLHSQTRFMVAANERVVLASLPSHPFVIEMRSAFRSGNHLYYTFDYFEGADLYEHSRRANIALGSEAAVFYSAEVLLALQHLHEHRIVYRDLKPENVLVDREGHIRLADMGLAKILPHQNSVTNSLVGTRSYLAPEMVMGNDYSFSVDFWQFGCFVFELFTGKSPFWTPHRHSGLASKNASTAKILAAEVAYPAGMDSHGRQLCSLLLEASPSKRLTSWQGVRSVGFFHHTNWTEVLQRRAIPPAVPIPASEKDLAPNFSKSYTQASARWADSSKLAKELFVNELTGFSFQRVKPRPRQDEPLA
ncbi:unnamed protein product [Chrysoparadoxa australica]